MFLYIDYYVDKLSNLNYVVLSYDETTKRHYIIFNLYVLPFLNISLCKLVLHEI